MPFSPAHTDRERDKFIENPAGETSVRVYISNEAGSEVPISGSFSSSYAAPTGPFLITVATITDVASNPIAAPLTNRVSVSIRNLSTTVTVYIGPSNTVTADNSATGGWDIGPGEDLHLDLDASNLFHMIATSGDTAFVKIMEIASSGSSGGGGGGSLTALQETPAGSVDGVNVTFTISQVPSTSGRFILFLDGLYLTPIVDYSTSGATITMVTAPAIGQTLGAYYEY